MGRRRDMAAFVLALCGGLAVLYLFFALIGTINLGNAAAATTVAVLLALVWAVSYWRRMRSGAGLAQRPDRERRGF